MEATGVVGAGGAMGMKVWTSESNLRLGKFEMPVFNKVEMSGRWKFTVERKTFPLPV